MMSQVVPGDTALAGALALLEAATRPKAAKDVLDKIATAKAEVDAKLADLAERQEKFNRGKVELREEREAHEAAVKSHQKDANALVTAMSDFDNRVAALSASEKRHKEAVATWQEASKAREAELDAREKSAAQAKREGTRAMTAAAAREMELDKREAAIAQGEAELADRWTRIQAAVLA